MGGKFGNQRRFGYDSKLEMAVFGLLSLFQDAKKILNLKHHPGTVFLTDARIQYRPDFSWYNGETKKLEFGEAKGYETETWRLKLKLWRFYGPGPLHIYRGTYTKPSLSEIVVPKNTLDKMD